MGRAWWWGVGFGVALAACSSDDNSARPLIERADAAAANGTSGAAADSASNTGGGTATSGASDAATSTGAADSTGTVPGTSGASGGGGSSSGEDGDCPDVSIGASRAAPDIMILLDRSGSMDTMVGNTNRWNGSAQAIETVVRELEAEAEFGLMTFPGQGRGPSTACEGISDPDACQACSVSGYPPQVCVLGICTADCTGFDRAACDACAVTRGGACGAAGLDVPLALMNAEPIATSLAGMRPNGATPTAQSLAAAAEVLAMRPLPDGAEFHPPRYVMLVTDGDPNCFTTTGGAGGSMDVAAQQATIEEVGKMAQAGIFTYVIGFQTAGTPFATILDQAAAAGGTGDTAHRSVDSGEQLLEEFREIAGAAASCTFVLSADADPSDIRVTVEGQPTDQWRLGADGRTIELVEGACESMRAGAAVSAEVDCAVVELF